MKQIFFLWGLLVVTVAASAWGYCYTFNHYKLPETTSDFGNSFGLVNVFVSAGALLFVAVTLRQTQRQIREGQEQFEEQQHHLNRSIRILEDQKEELSNQVAVMTGQAFDTRFFQLLQLLQSIVETVVFPAVGNNPAAHARAAFGNLYEAYRVGVVRLPELSPAIESSAKYQWRERVASAVIRILVAPYGKTITCPNSVRNHVLRRSG